MPLRVLVVEDDPDTAEVLAMMFEWLGCRTRTALGGLTALEVASDFDPDLVFVDIGLPDINGYEVARRVRWGFSGRRFVAALSGWAYPDHCPESRHVFDDHLLKPVGLEAIRKVVRAASTRLRP